MARRIGFRRLVVMGDHAISSFSNIVATVIAARLLDDATAFGAFSLAMIAYQLGLGAVRAVVGEPWLSAHSADDAVGRERAGRDLVRAAPAVGLLVSVLMAGASLVGESTSGALAVLAVAFPLLMLQDALRYVVIAHRPHLALASDVTWLLALVVILVVMPGVDTPTDFVAVWAGSGVVGLGAIAVPNAALWRGGSARRWLTEHRRMAAAFLGEFLSARAVAHLIVVALGAVAGLRAVGAVRAAQVFYGPLNTMFGGIYLVLVPDGARRRQHPEALLRIMRLASMAVGTSAAVWMVVGLVLPDRWGGALFGAETWRAADELLLPMGLGVLAGSLSTGAFSGIRSLGAARLSLAGRLTTLPVQVVFILGGALVADAYGYALGFVVASALGAAIWWWYFSVGLREVRAEMGSADRPDAETVVTEAW